MAGEAITKIGDKEYTQEDLLALAEKDARKGLKGEARRAAVSRLKRAHQKDWIKFYTEELQARGFTVKSSVRVS